MSRGIELRLSHRREVYVLVFIVAFTVAGLLANYRQQLKTILLGRGNVAQVRIVTDEEGHFLSLPEALLEAGVYKNGSFANEAGVVPAYWEGKEVQVPSPDRRKAYGPCYAYSNSDDVNWEKEIEKYNQTRQPWYNYERITKNNAMELDGYCRPGFLIIGKAPVRLL